MELYYYLQEPSLVARFQHLCGVRGTFPNQEETRTQPHNNGACHRGDEEENPAVMGAGEGGLRSRGKNLPKEEKENQPRNGSVVSRGEDVGGETLKPLRRNSLTGDAGQEFLIQNRFLYYLFTFGTELGNELFYITFFPFLMWNMDPFVSRRLIMVWVWVMFLGQCTKDVIGWSRPASPPVVKLEVFYNSEYSMPSTHAMSGTAIPFSLFVLTYGRWEVQCLFLVLFIQPG